MFDKIRTMFCRKPVEYKLHQFVTDHQGDKWVVVALFPTRVVLLKELSPYKDGTVERVRAGVYPVNNGVIGRHWKIKD